MIYGIVRIYGIKINHDNPLIMIIIVQTINVLATMQKVRVHLEELLASYKPEPLDDDTEREVQKVLERAQSILPGNVRE